MDLRNASPGLETALNTPASHDWNLVMTFGLTNISTIFQVQVNVIWDMLNRFVFVYLDILIFSKSVQEHVNHVQAVLKRQMENSLIVKVEKCDFHDSSFMQCPLTALTSSKDSFLWPPEDTA